MLVEFGLKALEQRERVGGSPCESGQYLIFVQSSYFARGCLDDDIAECDLSIAAHCDLFATSNGEYGGAVELFSLHANDYGGVGLGLGLEAKHKGRCGITAIFGLRAAPMLYLDEFFSHENRVFGHAKYFQKCRHQLIEIGKNNAIV